MASRNQNLGLRTNVPYEPNEKLPSNTLKRHPKMELNKNDLLRLLSYLEGELQARDITIAALKTDKAKQLLYQAKYGRFGLGDPFHALQRDSEGLKDISFDEAAVKAMYDNQLMQLENLIATQRKAQHRNREQLVAVEKRYHKVCSELEDERRKHAQDTAEGDDVTYMLEKERERLKQEVEFEKAQNKKLDRDVKKLASQLKEEKALAMQHKQVALLLIKESAIMSERMNEAQYVSEQAEQVVRSERDRSKVMEEGLSSENHRASTMEAEMEKQQLEFDVEREQMRLRLNREQSRTADLQSQVTQLQQQIQSFQSAAEVKSQRNSPVPAHGTPLGTQTMKLNSKYHSVDTPPHTPPEVRRSTPAHTGTPSGGALKSRPQSSGPTPSPAPRTHKPSANNVVDGTAAAGSTTAGSRLNIVSSSGTVLSSPTGGTTVFTTPSGTRISLNVGPNATSGAPHRVNRGTPPPVPPNKPTGVLTSPNPRAKSQHGGGVMSRPLPVQHQNSPASRSQPPTKFGITISKDKITISGSADSHTNTTTTTTTSSLRTLSTTTGAVHGTTSSAVGKSAQLDRVTLDPVDSNLDFLGPEMDDLEKLIVSLGATGASDRGSSEVVHQHSLPSLDSSHLVETMTLSSDHTNQHSRSDVVDSSHFSEAPPYSSDHTHIGPTLSTEHDTNLPLLSELLESSVINVNEQNESGVSMLHHAAIHGHLDLLELLLHYDVNANLQDDEQTTALHLAAHFGKLGFVKRLLLFGADPTIHDSLGWTCLHHAAAKGFDDVCQELLKYGSRIDVCNSNTSWTALHEAVNGGHSKTLQLLLTHHRTKRKDDSSSNSPGESSDRCDSPGSDAPENNSTDRSSPDDVHLDRSPSADSMEDVIRDVISLPDKDGWTIVHHAANQNHQECLSILHNFCGLDFTRKDKWGRTVSEIASTSCREYLNTICNSELLCSVKMSIPPEVISTTRHPISSYHISHLNLTQSTTWVELNHTLCNILTEHFANVSLGIQQKHVKSKAEDRGSRNSDPLYDLGLDISNVSYITIGDIKLQLGVDLKVSPFDLFTNNRVTDLYVSLYDYHSCRLDSLAYESLIALSTLHNYLRLVEQYHNAIFYGPSGTSKTFIARRLAHCIQCNERQIGNRAEIYVLTFGPTYTRNDLIDALLDAGCLIPQGQAPPSKLVPIFVLERLHTVNITEVLADIMPAIEGKKRHFIYVQTRERHDPERYYLLDCCYWIGVIDRSRSTGLDLAIQQHFRWIHLHNDAEPCFTMLQRHLHRKLQHKYGGTPVLHDDPVYRAVQWIVMVWQRLNEALIKLGLQEQTFGPSYFINCPLEANKPKTIYKWLCHLWNYTISPTVTNAVIKGSGNETSTRGQHKVAKTALYVLMQRAVVSGCPLSGQEKERYLMSFNGSNELDIKMRPASKPRHSESDTDSEPESPIPLPEPKCEPFEGGTMHPPRDPTGFRTSVYDNTELPPVYHGPHRTQAETVTAHKMHPKTDTTQRMLQNPDSTQRMHPQNDVTQGTHSNTDIAQRMTQIVKPMITLQSYLDQQSQESGLLHEVEDPDYDELMPMYSAEFHSVENDEEIEQLRREPTYTNDSSLQHSPTDVLNTHTNILVSQGNLSANNNNTITTVQHTSHTGHTGHTSHTGHIGVGAIDASGDVWETRSNTTLERHSSKLNSKIDHHSPTFERNGPKIATIAQRGHSIKAKSQLMTETATVTGLKSGSKLSIKSTPKPVLKTMMQPEGNALSQLSPKLLVRKLDKTFGNSGLTLASSNNKTTGKQQQPHQTISNVGNNDAMSHEGAEKYDSGDMSYMARHNVVQPGRRAMSPPPGRVTTAHYVKHRALSPEPTGYGSLGSRRQHKTHST